MKLCYFRLMAKQQINKMQFLSILLLITFTIGIATLSLLPLGAYSLDLKHYLEVLEVLDRGGNPYKETAHLNYAPAWMQTLWFVARVADRISLERETAIKVFNLICHLILVCSAFLTSSFFTTHKKAFWLNLLLLILNPVVILLIYIHGSFDPLVACLMIGTVCTLIWSWKNRDSIVWLYGSLLLGLGILFKTIPIVLTPLILQSRQWINWRTLALGLIIASLPCIVGLSTIYVLSRDAVLKKVINYESVPGYFGITGLFRLGEWDLSLDAIYVKFFTFSLITIIILYSILKGCDSKNMAQLLVKYPLFVLLFIVTFGPGFGTQYLLWVIPFCVLRLSITDEWYSFSNWIYGIFLFIAIPTYIYSYLSSPGLSGSLVSEVSNSLIDFRDLQKQATIERLPLFFSLVSLTIYEGLGLLSLYAQKNSD